MNEYKEIKEVLDQRGSDANFNYLTIGTVVDVNDPDQLGRVRALCPYMGDTKDKEIDQIPWAIPMTPFGGSVGGSRAYGMWSVPQIEAQVVVTCIEGNIKKRIYLGCLHPPHLTNTLPHGRYVAANGEAQFGPYDNHNEPIEPLYSNMQSAFRKPPPPGAGNVSGDNTATVPCQSSSSEGGTEEAPATPAEGDDEPKGLGEEGTKDTTVDSKVEETPAEPHKSDEWASRAVDRQATAITNDMVASPEFAQVRDTTVPDDIGKGEFIKVVNPITNTERELKGVGYAVDTLNPAREYSDTTKVGYASSVVALTSAGFHAFSMDDRPDNNRMRLRTKSGHQVILDDTNERMYFSTAAGNTWVELDSGGNIDIYCSRDLAIAADGDINLYARDRIRMAAEKGIHILSEKDVRIHAKTELHLKSDQSIFEEATNDINLKATGSIAATANAMIALKGEGGGYFQSGCALNLLSGGPVYVTGSEAHVNSTPAAESPEALSAVNAFTPNRIPEHEPWPRGYADAEKSDGEENNSYQRKPYSDPINRNKTDKQGKEKPIGAYRMA